MADSISLRMCCSSKGRFVRRWRIGRLSEDENLDIMVLEGTGLREK